MDTKAGRRNFITTAAIKYEKNRIKINDLVSVTVVCDNGALSDMLSTACFVLGAEKSQELLAHYDAQAIFIDQDKRVFITEGLRSRVSITAEGYMLLDSLS